MALKTLPFTFSRDKLAAFWGRRATNPFDYFQQWHEQPALHFGLPVPPWLVFRVNVLGIARLSLYLPCFVKVEIGYLYQWLRISNIGHHDGWQAEAYLGMKLDATETVERMRLVGAGTMSRWRMYDWLVSVSARVRTKRESVPSPLGMA